MNHKDPINPKHIRDLRGVACPECGAKAMVFASKIPLGSKGAVIVDQGLPEQNVPIRLRSIGCEILERTRFSDAEGNSVIFQIIHKKPKDA